MADFLDGPQPTQAVAWAAWQLGQLGYSRAELTSALELMRNLPWSQVSTEQGHSAASVVMKKHRLYGQALLQSRSMLGQLAILFNECPEQKKLEQLRRAYENLEKSQPQKCVGIHVYVSEMVTVATELLVAGRCLERTIAKRIICNSGERWRGLSVVQRERFDVKAQVLRAERQSELNDKKEEARSAIRKQRSLCEESKVGGGPLANGQLPLLAQ